jgi:hypothetical protein
MHDIKTQETSAIDIMMIFILLRTHSFFTLLEEGPMFARHQNIRLF